MKKYIHAVLLLSLVSLSAFTQSVTAQSEKLPAWLSEKGYWVIESNVKTPKNCVVHFYNNDHAVIYREKIEGLKLNLNRKKTLMRLKVALEQALTKWEITHTLKENDQLVANALK